MYLWQKEAAIKEKEKKYFPRKKLATNVKKYMAMAKRYVFRKIKTQAPSTFGLIVDGWSIESVHYFAIFITWANEKHGSVEERLIYFGENEEVDESTEFEDIADDQKYFGFTAADWLDVLCMALNDVFESYTVETRVNIHNFDAIVEFIAADNCATNSKLCKDSGAPMKGCDSHRLNLAVMEMLGPKKQSAEEQIRKKAAQDKADMLQQEK